MNKPVNEPMLRGFGQQLPGSGEGLSNTRRDRASIYRIRDQSSDDMLRSSNTDAISVVEGKE